MLKRLIEQGFLRGKFQGFICGVLVVLILVMCMGMASRRSCNEFYVAVNGNDSNPGTVDRPFATIGRARDAVREKVACGLKSDVKVLIGGGVYRISEPITFDLRDAGTEKFSITYMACPGEKAVISGGKVIEGFKDNGNGVWIAEVPGVREGKWKFIELFVNGRRAQRARYPNKGYLRVVEAGEDNHTSFTFKQGDIEVEGGIENAELVFFHDWAISRVPVKSIDKKSNTITTAYEIGRIGTQHTAITGAEKHPRYFLENCEAFLDEPGEWWLDVEKGLLKYRPLENEVIGEAEFVAPAAESLIEVRGDYVNDVPVVNLHFKGLSFQHCAWMYCKEGYRGRQASFHYVYPASRKKGQGARAEMPSAISFEAVERCSFEDNKVEHIGCSALKFGTACRGNRINGNRFFDIAANGIVIGETTDRFVGDKCWYQEVPYQAASRNVVSNNLIECCGQVYFGAVGIWAGITEKTIISHNLVRNLPYTGISLGWIWGQEPSPCYGNVVEYNHIHDVMGVLSDGGAVYMLGRQPESVIRGNLIHDVPSSHGRAPNEGIRWDNGASGFLVEGNVIYNVMDPIFWFNPWTYSSVIRNNYIVLPKEMKVLENLPHLEDIWDRLVVYHHKRRTSRRDIVIEDNTIYEGEEGVRKLKKVIKKARRNTGLKAEYRKKLFNRREVGESAKVLRRY